MATLCGVPQWLSQMALPVAIQLPERYFLGAAAIAASIQEHSPHQGFELNALFQATYRAIAKESDFSGVSSAAPFCFSRVAHDRGHYFRYLPESASPDSEKILCLHGFGGNFLFYLWVLKTEFPNSIVLIPSWTLAWTEGSSRDRRQYLQDMAKHFELETGIPFNRPWLFGISQGGIAAFELAGEFADDFRGLVSISSVPNRIFRYPPTFPIFLLNGARDDNFPIGIVRKCFLSLFELQDEIRKSADLLGDSKVKMGEIDDAGHFMLLSHRESLGKFIRKFIQAQDI